LRSENPYGGRQRSTTAAIIITTGGNCYDQAYSNRKPRRKRIYDASRDGSLYAKPGLDSDDRAIIGWILAHAPADKDEQLAIAREADHVLSQERALPEDEPLDQEDEQLIDLFLAHRAKRDAERLAIAREADRVIAEQQTDDEDTPLSPATEEIIGVLFGKPVVFVPSRDEAHRQERLNRILDHIAALPEPEQSEAIAVFGATVDLVARRAKAGGAA